MDRVFLKKMGDLWQSSTPGIRIQAHARGKKVLDVACGKTYEFYDWASVTKIVFTTTALMWKHDQGMFGISDPVSRWVPWFPEKSPWRMRDLLSHSAGMTWWYPFYKQIVKKTTVRTTPEEAWEIFQGILKRRVLADLSKRPRGEGPHRPPKTVYSDLDFFLLGIALESLSGTTLGTVWSEQRERLGLKRTDFHRGNRSILHPQKKCAPTEKDLSWRKKILQGEVHDQNTWSFKGIAPHAGLFGPIDDLSFWGLGLRAAMRGEDSKHFPSAKSVKLFTRRSLPRVRGDWGLGFMLPSKAGASCGGLFSAKSVGHTGFTGTSLWYDPKRDLLVTILSNRIHPSVDNIAIRELRPRVHTWVAESL
jgi:CubicO group peptidase (beta-lactamase class C family)